MGLTASTALVRATAQSAFWQGYESSTDIMDGLIHRVDSSSDQETYPGLFYAPRPRLMEGSRTHRTAPGFSFTITNNKYEATVDIGYELIKFGKLGAIDAMLASLGEKARMHPSRLVADLINVGDAGGSTGHDGQIYYSASHVDTGGANQTAQDNDLGASASATGAATVLEMYTALQASLAAFYTLLDGDSDPVVPGLDAKFVVLVPGGHMPAARAVFMNDQITGPIANDMKGIFEPRLNPYSDVAAEMFCFWTNARRKPFIYQVAEDVSLTDNMGGDAEFETKDVSFGTFGFYNVGYGEWRCANSTIFT